MPEQEALGPFSKRDLGVKAVIYNLEDHGLVLEELLGGAIGVQSDDIFGLKLDPGMFPAFRLTLAEPEPRSLTLASLPSGRLGEYSDYLALMKLLRQTRWTPNQQSAVVRILCQNLVQFFQARAAKTKSPANQSAFRANVTVLTRRVDSIAAPNLGLEEFARMVEPAVHRHWNFTTQAST